MRRSPLKSLFATLFNRTRNERGIVMPLVLLWALVLAIELGGMSVYAASRTRQIQSQINHMRTFYIAEAALEKLGSNVELFIQGNGRAPDDAELADMAAHAPGVGVNFSFDDVDAGYNGLGVAQELEHGTYVGLNGVVQTIDLAATARTTAGRNSTAVTLNQAIEVQLIPVFQFGIFYEEDLEMRPGAPMTFIGPVHSNQDIYLSTGASMSFQSSLAAKGDIIHGYKDGHPVGEQLGPITIEDSEGDAQSMWLSDESDWLDSNHPNWTLQSQDHWDGNVKSSSHNTPSLTVPLPSGSSARTLIVRRSAGDSAEVQAQKLDYKSHLRLIDGSVYNSAGASVDLRYCTSNGTIQNGPDGVYNTADDVCSNGTLQNPVISDSFTDLRENKTVITTDIDVDVLRSSPAFQAIQNTAPDGVIVYHSDYRNISGTTMPALRLINGSRLPSGGMTVATENPLYIKGDYNTVSKQPSGVASDITNVLSNNWDDTKSAQVLNNRTATATTVNSAVITGNKDTTPGVYQEYNGGYENILRFLEKWSGVTFTYKGSTIVLYNSEMTSGLFNGSGIYGAPSRNYSFDTDFSDADYAIPGFPAVYHITKSVWGQD